jgi:hypothetical protein
MKRVPGTFSVVANDYYLESGSDARSTEMRLEVQKHIGGELLHIRVLRATGWSSGGPPAYENGIRLSRDQAEALRTWLDNIDKWYEYVDSEDFSLDDVEDEE